MTVSRRAIMAGIPAFGLAACTGTGTTVTPANVTAAIAAITGIVDDVKAMIAGGTLTAAQAADAQMQLAALNAQIAALNASSTSTGVSSALTTVTNILTTLSSYLPLIVPILSLLATPGTSAKPDVPVQASLRVHLGDLRKAAQ